MAELPIGCNPYDLMIAGILDTIVDEIPRETVFTICEVANNPEEFFVGVQTSILLIDTIKKYYNET